MASRSARNATRASRAGTASPSALTGPSTRMSRHTTTSPAMPARSKTRWVSSPFRTCSIESWSLRRRRALAAEQVVALGGNLADQLRVGRAADDAVELGAIVADDADALDGNVPDEPAIVATDEPRVDDDVAALGARQPRAHVGPVALD